MKRTFFLIIIILALATCRETFNTPPQPRLGAEIKYSGGGTENPHISVFSPEMDSIWINGKRTSKIDLPLNINSTTELIILIDSIADILEFTHDYNISYESMTSGFFYTWELSKIAYTTNRIDSILVYNPIVTDKWDENIVIYINNLSDNTDDQ